MTTNNREDNVVSQGTDGTVALDQVAILPNFAPTAFWFMRWRPSKHGDFK
jgi:hypothetical protein